MSEPTSTPHNISATPHDAANWFEIATHDIERATKFYETLLNVTLIPVNFGEPKRLFPALETGVGGALVQNERQQPSPSGTMIFLNVDAGLGAALARMQASGTGAVVIPETMLPNGFGAFAYIEDSEGNHIGLHQH